MEPVSEYEDSEEENNEENKLKGIMEDGEFKPGFVHKKINKTKGLIKNYKKRNAYDN